MTALATMAAMIAVLAGWLLVASVQNARGVAQSAADLAALAGARALQDMAEPCGTAARVAAVNAATVVSCAVDGQDVVVEVRVQVEGTGLAATARARAGPSVGDP